MLRLSEALQQVDRITETRNRIQQYSQGITEQDAFTLTQAYLANPNVNAQAIASLALGGVPYQQINNIGAEVVRSMVRSGAQPQKINQIYEPRFFEIQALGLTRPQPSYSNQAARELEANPANNTNPTAPAVDYNNITGVDQQSSTSQPGSPPSVPLTFSLGGTGTSAVTPPWAQPTWVDRIDDNIVNKYQQIFDAVVPDNISRPVTAIAKGAVRSAVIAAKSVPQFANARMGQAMQAAEASGYSWWDPRYTVIAGNWMIGNADTKQVVDAAAQTQAGVLAQEFADTGVIDTGSGFFASESLQRRQAEAQRELLGTTTGYMGRETAWSYDRWFANQLVDVGLISNDSILYSMISGSVAATLELALDPTNLVPTRLIAASRNGLPIARNEAKYLNAARLARNLLEQGDDAAAVPLMHEALTHIGIGVDDYEPSRIRRLFDGVTDSDAAIRGFLLDEAGIIRDGNSVVIAAPEFQKYLISGSGRRLVDQLTERRTVSGVREVFKGQIHPVLAQELADATDAADVVRILGRVSADPGADMESVVRMFPHIGVFNLRDKGIQIRRAFHSRARIGKYLPPSSILDPQDPMQFVDDLDTMLSALPVGVAREGYARFDKRIVDEYVNRAAAAFSRGNRGDIVDLVSDLEGELATMFTRLGYSLEDAQALTRWSANADRLQTFAIKDINSGAAINVAEPGPLMYSQLLSNGMMLIDGERLQDVLRQTGRVRQILRNHSSWAKKQDEITDLTTRLETARDAGDAAEAANLSKQLRTAKGQLDEMRSGGDAVFWIDTAQMIADSGRYYWKSSTIARLAYVLRVTPDEVARVLLGGGFENGADWLMTVFDKRYTFDALGREFVRSNDKWMDAEEALAELVLERSELLRAGDTAAADALLVRIKDQEAAIDLLVDEFDESASSFHKALLTADRRRASETVMRERSTRLVRAETRQRVSRNVPKELDKWAEGLVQRLYAASVDEPMVELARALNGRDVGGLVPFPVRGEMGSLAEHLAAGRVATAEEGVAYWLFEGGGQPLWFDFATSMAARGMPYDVDSFDSVMNWVNSMVDELAVLTGAENVPLGIARASSLPASRIVNFDQQLMDAIATGRFQGQRLRYTSRRLKRTKYSDDAVAYAREFASNPRSPEAMIFDAADGVAGQDMNLYEQIMSFFFDSLYGVASDKLARNPMWRRIYWTQMSDLIRSASDEAAQEILANARKAGVSPRLMRRLEEGAGARLADASAQELSDVAKAAALVETRNLLFDATKRGAGADTLRFVVAFGDAWKEVFQTYGKILIRQKGKPAVRLAQGVFAAQRAEGLGPGDLYGYNPETGEYSALRDGDPEGLFWRDPTSGDLMFTLPGSQFVTSRGFSPVGATAGALGVSRLVPGAFRIPAMVIAGVAGGLSAGRESGLGDAAPALSGRVGGLNLAGSIFPGFMPGTDRIVNGLIPDHPRWNGMRDFLFAYGEPETPGTPAAAEFGIERLIIPSWLQKFATGLRGENDILNWFGNMLSGAETSGAYQRARNHVARSLMSTGEFSSLAVDQPGFQDRVTQVTDNLFMIRGIAQFVGPVAPLFTWFVETKQGSANAALLVDEMNKSMKQYIEAGQDPNRAMIDILDKYGPNIFMLFTPNTKSTLKGVDSSTEWFEWFQTNREFVETYPGVGAFFGPTGDFNLDSYTSLQRQGLYMPKTLDEQYEDAALSLAYSAYNKFRDETLGPEETWTREDRQTLAAIRKSLQDQFNIDMMSSQRMSERRQQLSELDTLLESAFTNGEQAMRYLNPETPMGSAVLTYMGARKSMQEEGLRRGLQSVDGWAMSSETLDLRMQMRSLGQILSQSSPEFARLYQFVLEGEMRLPDEEDFQVETVGGQ